MKHISMIVNGVTEAVKAKFKERRIMEAVRIARTNAEEKLEDAKAKLEDLPNTTKDMEANRIVSTISDLLEQKEIAEAQLKRIDAVEAYLNADEPEN